MRNIVHFLWISLLSLAVSAGQVASPDAGSVQLSTTNQAHSRKSAAPSTLRIGFWTLWHDRQVQVTPAGAATFRTCTHCDPTPFREPATIRVNESNRLILAFTNGKTIIHANALTLNGPIEIAAHGESELLHFPISFSARSGALVMAVSMPVESYVEQVVASESGPANSLESLKALAIVVRTYALHERHGHPDYDLCDSTHCQLLHWHGTQQRHSAAHTATLETTGETLWYQNQPALAYFNRDCGGRSAAVSDVWPRAHSSPYLASHDDRYCSRTSNQQWTADLTHAELSVALARRGLAAPGWQHLVLGRRAESGRAITVQLDQTILTTEDFRIAVGEALGWNRIQSNWFEVSQNGEHFLFHGRASGHGVGLCQKGAAVMSAQGNSATEILAQYFPGAYSADESTGKRWNTFKSDGFVLETLDASDASFVPQLARARAEASQASGLNSNASFTLRTFPSTSAFRDETLAPGWIAAFTEGNWIATQPLRVLAERHLLAETIQHEFLHALVEHEAGAGTPLWLREGLVELWSIAPAKQAAMRQRSPLTKPDTLDNTLQHAASEAQSQTAHTNAALYARRLLDRYGRAQVLEWLRSGMPAQVLLGIGQR